MFRAFYFQSKLGFTIEKETYNAISEYSSNANNIARERILIELKKMANDSHLEMALKSILNSKIIDFLSDFKDFIKYQIDNGIYFYKDDFFIIAYYFNIRITDFFIFSNQEIKDFELYKELLDAKTKIDSYSLYLYGRDVIKKYNSYCKYFIKDNYISEKEIDNIHNNLVVKNRKEILLSNLDIIKLVNKPAGPWVKEIETKIIKSILEGNLENNKTMIKKFVKELYNE